MNTTTSVRRTATTRAAEPAPPTWREHSQQFLRGFSAPLEGVMQIARQENLGSMLYLMPVVKHAFGKAYESAIGNETREELMESFMLLEVLLEAAHDHREASEPIRHILEGLRAKTDRFYTDVLDAGGEPSEAHHINVHCAEQHPQAAAKPAGSTLQKQSAALFVEIGSLADTIRHLSISNHILEETLETEQVATIVGVRAIAGQIGLIADMGAGMQGGNSATIAGADPAFWLLPPSYTEAGGRAA